MPVSTAGGNGITSINQQLIRRAISADLRSSIPTCPYLVVEEEEEEGGNGDSELVLCDCRLATGGSGVLCGSLGLISSIQAALPYCLQGTTGQQPITVWPSPAIPPDHIRSVTLPRSRRHDPWSANHDLVVPTAQLGSSSPLFRRLPTLTTTQDTSHRPP